MDHRFEAMTRRWIVFRKTWSVVSIALPTIFTISSLLSAGHDARLDNLEKK
jgi:hypothetical protein